MLGHALDVHGHYATFESSMVDKVITGHRLHEVDFCDCPKSQLSSAYESVSLPCMPFGRIYGISGFIEEKGFLLESIFEEMSGF